VPVATRRTARILNFIAAAVNQDESASGVLARHRVAAPFFQHFAGSFQALTDGFAYF
jgi:hypothetical protein